MNRKNVSIALLIVSNLFLINEIRTIEQDTINAIYMDQVESGHYNESSTDTMRDPMTGKLETMLENNHKNGRY